MVSFSKMLVGSMVAQASGLVLTPGPVRVNMRAGALSMAEPKQTFDNDMAGWKPPGASGGDAHACGGEYTATDTPDFLPEEGTDMAAKAAGISYTDGMQGSRTRAHVPKQRARIRRHNCRALRARGAFVPLALSFSALSCALSLPRPRLLLPLVPGPRL